MHTVDEINQYLKSQAATIKNSDEAIDCMLKCYRDFKIKATQEHEDEDMLLFQYGIYDWGNGRAFELNLTRQFEQEDRDEFVQLSLTLFYDPDLFTSVESFNTWHTDYQNLAEWEQAIRQTEGYQFSKTALLDKVEIGLTET